MASWRVLGSVLAVTLVAAVAAGAAPQRTAACAAPKPTSLKRPPAGTSATQLANFLLALPQRKPCDVDLFTSKFPNGTIGFYPEGRAMKPADGPVPTETRVRSQLSSYFAGSAHKAAALALFDRNDVKATVPDPTLRAALVSLRGTVAEPSIGYFLSRTYSVPPAFTPFPNNAIGKSLGAGGIFVNSRYEREHFGLFAGALAHEMLHHDVSTPGAEEAILNALTAIVHMQLLSRRPELATMHTELSRQLNDLVLALLNSRTPGSAGIAIVAPNGRGVVPGSPRNAPDFFALALKALGQSNPADVAPAPPVLAVVLRKLVGSGVALPKPLTYSKKTAELMAKSNDTWLSPVDRLRVSVLLGLVSMEEVVKYTGLTRPKAIAMFRLAPILAAMK